MYFVVSFNLVQIALILSILYTAIQTDSYL